MRIISKHNKKDFYDYSGFGYDTTDDIIFLRFPEEETVDNNKKYYRYLRENVCNRIPYSNSLSDNYFITYAIAGIYPFCYIIPFLTTDDTDNLTKQQIVIPYDLTNKKVEDINDFLIEIAQNIRLPQEKYKSKYPINFIKESYWEDKEMFRQIETPIFLYYSGHIIKNIIFNEQITNWLKYIKDDLDKRDVYTDIENYLWSMKQEPISEPDNNTKIVSHGFDLRTSFRKM